MLANAAAALRAVRSTMVLPPQAVLCCGGGRASGSVHVLQVLTAPAPPLERSHGSGQADTQSTLLLPDPTTSLAGSCSSCHGMRLGSARPGQARPQARRAPSLSIFEPASHACRSDAPLRVLLSPWPPTSRAGAACSRTALWRGSPAACPPPAGPQGALTWAPSGSRAGQTPPPRPARTPRGPAT